MNDELFTAWFKAFTAELLHLFIFNFHLHLKWKLLCVMPCEVGVFCGYEVV